MSIGYCYACNGPLESGRCMNFGCAQWGLGQQPSIGRNRGGKRPGAGRKAGSDWSKSGKHLPHVRVGIMLTAQHYTWLKKQGKRSKIIRRLIQDAITKEEQEL